MKIVYFDCPSGASGGMMLGALVDVGVPLEALRAELTKLGLSGWTLSAREVRRGAFRATKVDVQVEPGAHHAHRHLGDIVRVLEASGLAPAIVAGAVKIFRRLAEAEARVHGGSVDEVHFHEVGAVDAIVDVTGAVLGLHLLGTPNVLRVFAGSTAGEGASETVAQVETTIDDMSPQLYEPLMERLFEAGALDVFLTPVIMKRSRPGTVLTALCPPDRVSDLSRVLFEESSTIGVRWTEVARARLEREMVTIPTTYGALPFKVSRLGGRVVTVTPEFAEVVRLAREKSLAVREVLDQARADARRLLGG